VLLIPAIVSRVLRRADFYGNGGLWQGICSVVGAVIRIERLNPNADYVSVALDASKHTTEHVKTTLLIHLQEGLDTR
jgi:hypothetical protein